MQKDVILSSVEIARVVLKSYRWVLHHDVMLVMIMQILDVVSDSRARESVGVVGEDFSQVHVVNVRPHLARLATL